MKHQTCNPYLPSWEYVPDGEPHIFNGRIYVYGSHDRFNGYAFCLNDYICWSAPTDDLGDWRYEGVIYKRTDDPLNKDDKMVLYAPDVAQGKDGKYYLYYVLDGVSTVSVAVCDTPAGRYKYYGTVHYPDGTALGENTGDEPQFDPAVLVEGDNVYLYTGFCWQTDETRHGAMVTLLDLDMITVKKAPEYIVPGKMRSIGTQYENHAFFEASSIRKMEDKYCFIYSSEKMHELCYAVSSLPTGPFTYGGVLISNCEIGIDTYKSSQQPMYYGGNNHGSIVQINGEWYVFYHRQTNGHHFSRQGCIEPLKRRQDGSFIQASMTSCGASGKAFETPGTYSAHMACRLYCKTPSAIIGDVGEWKDARFPKITQDGDDESKLPPYIGNMRDGATAGFCSWQCEGITRIEICVRGFCHGKFQVRVAWDKAPIGEIPVSPSTQWQSFSAEICVPDGRQELYFTYCGDGYASLKSFSLY